MSLNLPRSRHTLLMMTLVAALGAKACTDDRRQVDEPVKTAKTFVMPGDDAAQSEEADVESKTSVALDAADDMASEAADTDMGGGPLAAAPASSAPPAWNTERYRRLEEQSYRDAKATPLSTFSIDVDTAGYSIVRRFLTNGQLPPQGAVRIEEMLNYFDYKYPAPSGDHPFAIHTAAAVAPWDDSRRLVRIGIKGQEIAPAETPRANLIFLIDVSGSMEDEAKLPLLRRAFKLLVDRLRDDDKVGIVVYAGSSGVVLEPTSDKQRILEALDRLSAGGSTNGAQGIEAAYKLAAANFAKEGINRVILATDGDFNVGVTSESDLVSLIETKAKSGIFLSVIGFGDGNYNDSAMEQLADKGNGNYAYIDTLDEARKVLVQQMAGTLVTIAKDVKIQVEFNPALVASYRLIGYENRALADEDFNDDQKDAGEIGAGHTVTALYEVVPRGAASKDAPKVDALRYQKRDATGDGADELLTVKVRYKRPDGTKSQLITQTLRDSPKTLDQSDPDFRFAAAVAAFGMKIRDSRFAPKVDFGDVLRLAKSGLADDADGVRAEFLSLVRKAESLTGH